MVKRLTVTVLVNDIAATPGLQPEHGFAAWVVVDGRCVLFDTGQGKALPPNSEVLGIDLEASEAVVLSHGHYDHTGGLANLLGSSHHPRLFAHPAVLQDRYSRHGKAARESIGIPLDSRDSLRLRNGDIVWTEHPSRIFEGLYVTGEIPRHNIFEYPGKRYFSDPGFQQRDWLVDDQALYIESPSGLVVLLGCTHAGVVNTLSYVCKLAERNNIHAVIGGMHLLRASRERLEATAGALEKYNVQVIAPCHCTGTGAMAFLRDRFPDRFVECTAGSKFVFE